MVRSLLVGFLALGVCRAAAPTDRVIESIQQHYNKARTLSVDFVEDYSVQGRPRPAEAGKLTLRKQGKMRWDYSKPAGKVFVSDGKTVILYTSADNKAEKVPLKDTEDMRAPLAFLLGHLELKQEFRDIQVRQEGSSWWLDAKAKSDRTPYSGIEMLVDSNGEVTKLRVFGRDESVLDFAFSHEQVNPPVSDALFHFAIPAGAEVVNAVDYRGQDR